jgi:hypothetical protein
MGRWRRWPLNSIPTVLQKLNLSIPQFLCGSPRFVIPFPPSYAGYFKSPEIFRQRRPALSFIEILFLLDVSGHFQYPSRPPYLALYSMLPFPIKNRYSVCSLLSNVRRLDSSLSTAMAELLLPVSATFHSAFNFAPNHCSSEYGRLTWPL